MIQRYRVLGRSVAEGDELQPLLAKAYAQKAQVLCECRSGWISPVGLPVQGMFANLRQSDGAINHPAAGRDLTSSGLVQDRITCQAHGRRIARVGRSPGQNFVQHSPQ